ncbi:MAG: hypothetical protein ACYDCL_04570, partial [Myxococcales bacterium]
YYKEVKAAIKSYFGSRSAILSSFGIAPDKALSTTSAKKLVAAAKRSQTRTVRGTLGKKQKLKVTVVGEPPVTIATDGKVAAGAPPVNLPAASNTPAAPAAPAPAGSGSGGGTPGGSGTPSAA